MDLTEEKDKEEPTRKRRETRQVLDPIRIAGKKRRNNDDGILEEDYKNVLLDDPTTATGEHCRNELKQSGAQLPVLEEARLFTSSHISTLFDGSVSSSLGAMRPLVEKLDILLTPAQEYYKRLPKRIKEGIHLLKDDVEVISSYLDELSELEDPPPMAICWMNEARDLSYDMVDYIDSLLFVPPDRFIKKKKRKKRNKKMMIKKRLKWYKQIAFTAQVSEHGAKTSKIIYVNVPRLPSKPKIAETISEFRIYVQEAFERHARYKLQCCSTLRRSRFLSTGSVLPMPYEQAAQIVIDGRMNEFIYSLAANDTAGQQQLKVVSVLGSGCLGKSTLANVLYERIGMQFECRAFIRVSKKPDMKRLFSDLFSQLHQKQPLPASCSELGISDNTSKHLQDKRYLIVIDDLWDASVWHIIKHVFPSGNRGSRIIITTQIEDVALTCCCDHSEHVFAMKPLDDDHSRMLFFNRLFGSKNDCPIEFKHVSNEIIDICGGLPLATISIASHLANQQTAVSLDLLTYIRDSLRSHVWSSSTSERTRQVLNLSYNNLAHYLKTCLLYLHIYPEGSVIWKDDVVKQWVAEGFIATRKWEVQDQETIEKAAGIYFDELIDRRFIQPLYINYNNKVLSCTVHDVVRDLIAQKSAEENFIVVVDYNRKIIALTHKVRRLSLVFGDAKYAKTPANITKSQVRSLTFCGLFKCIPCITEFKVLRVLNLQLSGLCGDHDPLDLTGISELFQLKYLKIASDVCIKLPNRMRGLQCLETLDVMDVIRVTVVPWDIMNLPHLLHLSLPVDTNLLDWICSMSDPVISLSSLGKLNYLQDLYLTSPSTHPSYHLERSTEALGSLIGGHGNLKTIVVAHGSSVKKIIVCGTPKVTISWDRMAPPPLLQRFECSQHSYIIFYRIPRWVKELGNLCILKIAVKELQMICVGILRGLRALTALSLYVETAPLDKIIFDKAGFTVLKHFKLRFMSGIAWLKFEAYAMPNLWNLKLVFNAIPRLDQDLFISSNQTSFEAYQHGTALINIEHMPGLKEISAKFGGAAADVEYALRIGISNHPSNPAINVPSGGYSSYSDQRANQKQQPNDKRISRSHESSSRLHVPDSATGRIAAGCGFENQIISDYVGLRHDIEGQARAGGSGFGFLAGGEKHGAGSNLIEQHSIGGNLIEQHGAGSNLIEQYGAGSNLFGEIGRELSISCILHLSRSDYGSVASLNREFNSLVRTGEIYRQRRHNGVVEHWIYFSLNAMEWGAYDLYRERWIKVPRMPPDECFMSSHKESLAVGTELLVYGNGMYRYSILTNSWGSAVPMNSPRSLFGSASVGEKAYVAGGTDSSGRILSSAEMYNSETHTWTPLPSMNRERKLCCGVFMDGKFYVIGGVTNNNNKGLACGEEYDLNRQCWTVIKNMCEGLNTDVFGGAPPLFAVVNNELYAANYRSGDVKRYDKMNNKWITLGKLPQRSAAAVNGRYLAFLACGDRLIVVHGARTSTAGMVEFHSWIPGQQPPLWNLFGTQLSESLVFDCAVMGC